MSQQRWLGPIDSRVPILVQIGDARADEVEAGVKQFLRDYPPALHGSNPGSVVQSVTGAYYCSIALIPAHGCDLSKWGLLAQ